MNDVTHAETASGAEQFLTFVLGGEEYGVTILQVQGIQGWDRCTPIPNTPDYILGVINLRGAIVPIVDLRRRFGMPAAEFGPTTVVIVVRVATERSERTLGLVVDAAAAARQRHRLADRHHARGRLHEHDAGIVRRIAQFLDVLGIVAADAEDAVDLHYR